MHSELSLPPWPMERLLKEACAYSNIHHPHKEKVRWDKSPWPILYGAVLAYLRHSHSSYDGDLAKGVDRERLRERIRRAAAIAYPWLRPERDPRRKQADTPEPDNSTAERPFDNFSHELATLVEARARLTLTLQVERRGRLPGWRERVAEAEGRLKTINTRIEKLNAHFQSPVQRDERGAWVAPLWCAHSNPGQYDFAGRSLAPNYTISTGFKCPECKQLVMRTKVAIPVGAGKRRVILSCHCLP
jgi:hypothetical protein